VIKDQNGEMLLLRPRQQQIVYETSLFTYNLPWGNLQEKPKPNKWYGAEEKGFLIKVREDDPNTANVHIFLAALVDVKVGDKIEKQMQWRYRHLEHQEAASFVKGMVSPLKKGENKELIVERIQPWSVKIMSVNAILEIDFDKVWVTLKKKKPSPSVP
jgi:hypothetical protein